MGSIWDGARATLDLAITFAGQPVKIGALPVSLMVYDDEAAEWDDMQGQHRSVHAPTLPGRVRQGDPVIVYKSDGVTIQRETTVRSAPYLQFGLWYVPII